MWKQGLGCLLTLMSFVPTVRAEEVPAADEPVGTGVVLMGYTLLVTAFVLLPMASFWLASHYLMEDDQPKNAALLYLAYVIIVPLFIYLSSTLIELLPSENLTFVTVSFLGVAGVALSLCLFVIMKIYYTNVLRALGFIVISLGLVAGGLFGMYTALSTVPAGEFAVEKSNELGRVVVPRVETLKERLLNELRDTFWASFLPESWFQELDSNLSGNETEEIEDSEPQDPLEWVKSSMFGVGDQVELAREVSFESEFGDMTLPVGSIITIVGPTDTPKRWEVKRGLTRFEVTEVDLRNP